MERVVFLDRDGTLNEEVHYLHRTSELKLLLGVPEALRMLREAGYRLVVVTNQAGVARGYYGEEDVRNLHVYMNHILEGQGASIDAFYYCPHHPEHGTGPYKKECRCRKPGTGMFEAAAQRFEIDKPHSFMIGDKLLDVVAGNSYGLTTILVGTGYGSGIRSQEEKEGLSPVYDYYAEDLVKAAQWIIEKGQAD